MKLSYRRLDLQLAHTWTLARGAGTTLCKAVVVELTGADGTVGLGEAAPNSRYKESVDTVQAFLKKVDARGLSFNDVEGSMTYLDTVSPHDMSAKCALNLALLDGAAKRAQKPLYDFLELGFRENHHLTSFTIGIDKPDMIRQKVLEAEQYPVLKVKVGVADDKANLQALREVAPTKTVRVDANEGWKTKEQALEMIEWLAKDGHIEFVEQPMPAATPVKDWVWLKQRSPLPIFGRRILSSGQGCGPGGGVFSRREREIGQDRRRQRRLRRPPGGAQGRIEDHAGLHDREQHSHQRRRAPRRVVRLPRPGRQHPDHQRPLRRRHGGERDAFVRGRAGEIRLAGQPALIGLIWAQSKRGLCLRPGKPVPCGSNVGLWAGLRTCNSSFSVLGFPHGHSELPGHH